MLNRHRACAISRDMCPCAKSKYTFDFFIPTLGHLFTDTYWAPMKNKGTCLLSKPPMLEGKIEQTFSKFLPNFAKFWRFLPCDALRYTVFVVVILSVCLSVWLSVCPFVTLVDCVHTVRPTIMISSPYGSPIILVSGDITFIPKFEGGHPERGRWMRVGWVLIGDFRPISRRISETVRDTTKVTINH